MAVLNMCTVGSTKVTNLKRKTTTRQIHVQSLGDFVSRSSLLVGTSKNGNNLAFGILTWFVDIYTPLPWSFTNALLLWCLMFHTAHRWKRLSSAHLMDATDYTISVLVSGCGNIAKQNHSLFVQFLSQLSAKKISSRLQVTTGVTPLNAIDMFAKEHESERMQFRT